MINILEYQKTDGELNKMEREIFFDPNKKEAQNMVEIVKGAQNKTMQLELEAGNLLNELKKLKEVQEKGLSMVEKLSKVNIDELSEDDLKETSVKLQQTNSQLKEVENRLSACGYRINSVIQEFENVKNKIFKARKRHQECKLAFEGARTKLEPEINALKSKLQEMEKGIDADILKKYKSVRQENIFPVFVPLLDNRCGGCRMELSTTAENKLKANKMMACDHCRRIIFIK